MSMMYHVEKNLQIVMRFNACNKIRTKAYRKYMLPKESDIW